MTDSPPVSLVWLFDIDGTLLLTQGAGRDALVLALRDHFGVHDELEGIRFSGRTDPVIVADVLARHGLSFDGDEPLWWSRVTEHMRRLMDPPRGGLLAGAAEVLQGVAAEPAWVSTLLTGNVSEMAKIKLESFGVWERFAFGTFGEEGADRDDLARLAVRRAVERFGIAPAQCVIVGDTEHDVACARAAGATAVAVATGNRTREQLGACAPDLLLDDLTASRVLLEWAKRL